MGGEPEISRHDSTIPETSNCLQLKRWVVRGVEHSIDRSGQRLPHDEKDLLVIQAGVGEGKVGA